MGVWVSDGPVELFQHHHFKQFNFRWGNVRRRVRVLGSEEFGRAVLDFGKDVLDFREFGRCEVPVHKDKCAAPNAGPHGRSSTVVRHNVVLGVAYPGQVQLSQVGLSNETRSNLKVQEELP